MSEVSRNAHAYTIQEENSTTYCGCCGPFEVLETCRREELKAKATTDHEKKKAAYHKIRGLRRCQNAECGVHLAS